MSGLDFWLQKMDSYALAREAARSEGDAFEHIQRTEMVKVIILSDECRRRVGR